MQAPLDGETPAPADDQSGELPMFAGASAPPPPMATDLMSIIKGEAAVVADEAAKDLSKASQSVESIAEHLKTPIRKQEPQQPIEKQPEAQEEAKEVPAAESTVDSASPAQATATDAPKAKGKDAQAKGRVCPYCAKQAGKGRFCIECGKELGMPDKTNNGLSALDLSDTLRQLKIPAQPPTASRFPAATTNSVSDPGFAVERRVAVREPEVAGVEAKAPLKSLHEDPFRRIPRRDATPGLSPPPPPPDVPKPDQLGFPANAWFAGEDKSQNVEF